MSLSERIRPNCEAAPWVCDEVEALESRMKYLVSEKDSLASLCQSQLDEIEFLKNATSEMLKALENIADGNTPWLEVNELSTSPASVYEKYAQHVADEWVRKIAKRAMKSKVGE